MQIHNLVGKKRRRKRIGRGGKRGTYSGRGIKGQKSRAGHRIRPAIRDYLKQIPKLRGRHKHSFTSVRRKPVVVSIDRIGEVFASRETVNPKTLVAKGLVSKTRLRFSGVKILGGGKLSKKITIRGCAISQGAKKILEEAGGKVI